MERCGRVSELHTSIAVALLGAARFLRGPVVSSRLVPGCLVSSGSTASYCPQFQVDQLGM